MQKLVKPVVGFEESYYVTSDGEVFSKDRIIVSKTGKVYHKRGRKIKQFIGTSGYMIVGLHREGHGKMVTVHRLIAQAFLPNPDNLPQINHKNEDKTDNRVENLEWCDGKYNSNYGTGIQRRVAKFNKEVSCYTKEGELVAIFPNETEAAKHYGVKLSSISRAICKGEPYTCKGLYWKFTTKNQKNYVSETERAAGFVQNPERTYPNRKRW